MRTKTIGRQPTDHGPWVPGTVAGKKFCYQLFGCTWESLHDNNNTAPAVWDGGDTITPNTVDWKLVSGSTDAWLANQNKPAQSVDYPFNGMGRVKLLKHVVDGHNLLYQDDFYKGEVGSRVPNTNTIFEVRYAFELAEDITIPSGCVLKFEGGSISGAYTLTLNDTTIEGTPTINVVLDGTIANNKVYAEWFGVKPGNNNIGGNNTAFTNYIIPSMENISPDYPYTPKTLCSETSFSYSTPLEFSGKYNINFNGSISYTGIANSTAIKIGRDSQRTTERRFHIFNLDGDSSLIKNGSSINDYVGLDFVNVKNCKMQCDYCGGFSYALRLHGKNQGCASNIVEISNIGKESYNAIKLLATGTGWVNENLFICGSITNYTSNPCHDEAIGIHIDSSQSEYLANNNLFIKPNLEGQHIAFKIDSGNDNTLFEARLEEVDNPIIYDGTESTGTNTIVYSDKANINIATSSLIGVARFKDLVRTSLPIVANENIRYKTFTDSGGSNVLVANTECCAEKNIRPRGGMYCGYLFDIKDAENIISAKTDIPGTFGCVLFDINNEPITLTSENASDFLTYFDPSLFNDSNVSIRSDTSAVNTYTICVKSSAVSKVFIGRIRTAAVPSVFEVRGVGIKRHKVFNFPLADNGDYNYIEILDNIIIPSSTVFYRDRADNCTFVLYKDIDLNGADTTMGNNMKIILKGGKFVNGKVRINGAVVEGGYENLLGTGATFTGSSFAGATTLYWQNGKPTWSNGNQWIYADGTPVV